MTLRVTVSVNNKRMLGVEVELITTEFCSSARGCVDEIATQARKLLDTFASFSSSRRRVITQAPHFPSLTTLPRCIKWKTPPILELTFQYGSFLSIPAVVARFVAKKKKRKFEELI